MEKPRLLDQVRKAIRVRQYSYATEKAYVQWTRRYILFHDRRHPREMGAPQLTAFLSSLATHRHVSPATQNQALNALLFLYREVLEIDLPWLDNVIRAKRLKSIPVVLTTEEVHRILACLSGTKHLMANLMYGAGLRVSECLRLRVKDLDFGYGKILIRDSKGRKDRITLMPERLTEALRTQLEHVRAIHNG